MTRIEESLLRLSGNGSLDRPLVLWGISGQTKDIIGWLRGNGYGSNLLFIADNFKYSYCHAYEGVAVVEAGRLRTLDRSSFAVLYATRYPDSVQRQLEAYGCTEIFNLNNPAQGPVLKKCGGSYRFTDRGRGRRYLCYILAGYEPSIWDGTLARVEAYQCEAVDYCLVSSGKYDGALDALAERNNWSYLSTERNQVCYIQNLVIDLHPAAEYIFKLDEDIFIGPCFFEGMIRAYHRIERRGEYRIGFAAPVIPLNCCGYVSYLKLTGKLEEFEERFGRAYRSRYSAMYEEEAAEFLWGTIDSFDAMAERFLQNTGERILSCYYNIGCILFSRERWLMMGKWPEEPGESGMGSDEAHIDRDNWEKDMPVYEIQSVLAGHLAFGPQKKRMLAYYQEHPEKFRVSRKREEYLNRRVGNGAERGTCPHDPQGAFELV